jgi:hypothetical protein
LVTSPVPWSMVVCDTVCSTAPQGFSDSCEGHHGSEDQSALEPDRAAAVVTLLSSEALASHSIVLSLSLRTNLPSQATEIVWEGG